MITIGAMIKASGRGIFSVQSQQTVFEALQFMATKNIGAVLVIDQGALVGIFSERDYARKVALKGLASTSTTVQEVMSAQVRCARLDDTVMGCMDLMTQKHIRHLPVLEDQRLLGILSIGDLVKAVIEDQQFQIKQLEEYIRA